MAYMIFTTDSENYRDEEDVFISLRYKKIQTKKIYINNFKKS